MAFGAVSTTAEAGVPQHFARDSSVAGPRSYTFVPVEHCNMCGGTSFRMLGMRLSGRVGRRPRQATGIAVPVKRCRDCGLVFADPQPVPASLADHYGLPAEEYWDAEEVKPQPDYFTNEISTAKRLLAFKPGMKALDVGVGLGKVMSALDRAGFDAWGVEPSPSFRDMAVEFMGHDPDRIQLTTIEAAEFPAETFDFISFSAVLEHLYDPSRALGLALGWLRPGGIIHVEVPSSDYLISKLVNVYFRLRGTNYVTNISPMHPPFHLYEFTLRSFEQKARQLPFVVREHAYRVCHIYHVPHVLKPPMRWWMDRTGTGMQLTVYLQNRS